MKLKYYFMSVASALMLSNCAQEETPQSSQGNVKTLTATIEGSSRSAVTDGGVFSWTEGDAISVWNGESFTTFTRSNGNVFTTSEEAINPSGVAIYPANIGHDYNNSIVTVNLATEYAYGSTNAPMVAEIGSTALTFKHVGGLMRFIVKDVPTTATSFKFKTDKIITGNFDVVENDDEKVIQAIEGTPTEVTINFEAPSTPTTMTFYVPLPTGTYEGYTVTVGDKSNTTDDAVVNTIGRGTLLLMPTFTINGTQLTKGDNAFTLENTVQDMNVSGDETLVIETPNSNDANAQLNLNYAPAEENATLNISDGQTGESQNSKAKVVVDVKNNNTVAELNIDAPTLTVELASGTYETITAKTAMQTLIIKSGVKVQKLIVKGGEVEIEDGANVEERTDITLRVLTFEDEDAKFSPYELEYGDWLTIEKWSDLIDDPQYGGPLTYGDYMSAMYTWQDEGNTELTHTFPNNYAYCFWGGGHAISNYWGEGWTDEDRDTHIAKYYGEDYVADNAGDDSKLGWFNLQMMIPVKPHSGDNFAVHYGYKDFFSYVENLPEISFGDDEARVIDHMYVTNTNYTLNQLYMGVKSEAGNSFGGNWSGLTKDAWLKIVAYGFDDVEADAYAEPISKVEFYLVQGENVVTDWQKWDLSELGAVKKVRFNFLYSDEMGGKYGLTIPGYFAYDDIAVRFEK